MQVNTLAAQSRTRWGRVVLTLILLAAAGYILIFAYAESVAETMRLAFLTTSMFFATSFLILGSFVGFIFGIPRSIARTTVIGNTTTNGGEQNQKVVGQNLNNSYEGPILTVNDNLERVSDWLTTIIIGITLVNLGKIPDLLSDFAGFMAGSFGNPSAPTGIEGFSIALLITYTACGVLLGFLVTRLILQGAFHRADSGLYDELDKVQQNLTGLHSEVQTLTSQLAMKGANQRNVIDTIAGWLSSSELGTPETVEEIKKQIQAASPSTKASIFFTARSAVEHGDKEVKRKAIPVIEALNEGDDKEKFTDNYALLGYIYRDLGEYLKSSENFSKAIEIRSRGPDSDSDREYELQQAIALIRLDRQEDAEEIRRLARLLGERERKTKDYAEVQKWLNEHPPT